MILAFKVTKQFSYGNEKVMALFSEEKDALEFMNAKVEWDHKTRIATIYRLYTNDDEIALEIDASVHESVITNSTNNTTGGEKRGTGFSPLSTTPRAPGTAPSSSKQDDDDDL